MRKTLKSRSEVVHFWANKVQSEGKAGNMFFDGDYVFSYGRHFCIARHLPNGVVAFTERRYSSSTAQHVAKARSAASHLKIIYCNDPMDSALQNMQYAQHSVVAALRDADKPRIRQTTRDGFKAQALRIAEKANIYLAALPASERVGVTPIDTTNLEFIREVMERAAETQKRLDADRRIAQAREAKDRLDAWKIDPTIHTSGFHSLPVALRLHESRGAFNAGGLLPDSGTEGKQVIQTSYGAEIPVSFAKRLWLAIQAVRASGNDKEDIGMPCGHYTLNTIRADGSIVVGCHDIPFSEIEHMAEKLGFAVIA